MQLSQASNRFCIWMRLGQARKRAELVSFASPVPAWQRRALGIGKVDPVERHRG